MQPIGLRQNIISNKNSPIDDLSNLSGCRFGHLSVLRQLNSMNYECRCDCGNVISVSQNNLLRGHQKSCGCARHTRLVDDITGLRSGSLVAIAPTDIKRRGCYLWRCQCDCGKELLVEPYKIRSHSVKSCGCSRVGKNVKDLTGMRFGKLVALKRLDEKIGTSYAWLCQCDCGKQIKVSTNALLSAPGTRSCGCGRVEAVMQTIDTHGSIAKHCHFVDDTCIEKIRNAKLQRNNRSGYTGVQIRGSKYIAIITFRKKVYYLGSFSKIEDAVRVRKQAEARLFGEFLDWYDSKYPSCVDNPINRILSQRDSIETTDNVSEQSSNTEVQYAE